ncbi:MAG: hypothetical protein BGO49_27180 [Planctomycetales bacterium 71-10]|nr:MAG: hypothetical protein BGO49_27180 [Planctomycetales bacterium 71-10]
MAIDLNLLRSKTVGPAPGGPRGLSRRVSKFTAGTGFGLTKNKKGKAGSKAGLGHKGRATSTGGKPRRVSTVGTGVSTPKGPGAFGAGASPSTRLPNRSKPATSASSSGGFLGRFFKRFRSGS